MYPMWCYVPFRFRTLHGLNNCYKSSLVLIMARKIIVNKERIILQRRILYLEYIQLRIYIIFNISSIYICLVYRRLEKVHTHLCFDIAFFGIILHLCLRRSGYRLDSACWDFKNMFYLSFTDRFF